MTTEQGFNADQRASERAAQPIVIGGQTFHRRRSTNQQQRELLRIAREQDRVNRRQEKHVDLIDAVEAGKPQDELDRLKQIAGAATTDVDQLTEITDQLADDARALTFQMLTVQLKHADTDAAPAVEFLEDNLDAEDVMPLVKYLSGRPVDPPTQATSEAGST